MEINLMNQMNITQTFEAKDLQIGFVQTEIANDYYYMVAGQEPIGPYADEEDAYRGWFFNQEPVNWVPVIEAFNKL